MKGRAPTGAVVAVPSLMTDSMKLGLLWVCTALLGVGCSSSATSPGGDGGGEAAVTNESGVTVDGGSEGAVTNESGVMTEGGSEAAGDSGPLTDATGSVADGAAACNALTNAASPVTGTEVAQNPPTLVGGTIVDGTYFLTALTTYTGPQGPTGSSGMSQTTIKISGGTIQVAANGTPATRNATLTTTGDQFTSTDTCPDTSVIQGTYTATATTLVVQFNAGTDDAGTRTVAESFSLSH